MADLAFGNRIRENIPQFPTSAYSDRPMHVIEINLLNARTEGFPQDQAKFAGIASRRALWGSSASPPCWQSTTVAWTMEESLPEEPHGAPL